MQQLSHHHSHSHPGLAVGAALALTLLLAWLGWQGAEQVGRRVSFRLPHATGGLPSLPRLPDGPHLPAAPIPMPK